MEKQNLENKLVSKQVKPTAMRNLVLKFFVEHQNAVSLSELENYLDSADKSTLFRTLKTFERNNLVHSIDDGTGQIKYALCKETCDNHNDHHHFHFTCIKCDQTFCLPKVKLPPMELPSKFVIKETNLVLKGLCSQCS